MTQTTITTEIHTAFIVSGEHRHVIRFTSATQDKAFHAIGRMIMSGRITWLEGAKLAYQVWELMECQGR